MNNNKRLQLSSTNRVYKGVIGGIGEYLGLSRDIITIIRILYVIIGFSTGLFPFIVAYFVLAWILPSAPAQRPTTQSFYQPYGQPSQPKDVTHTGTTTNTSSSSSSTKADDDWSDF
jgi:phage shock protein PspC (stress-responsive transcriptional regulator)